MERLGGVLKRLGALLKAIWPDTEKVEKPLVFFVFRSLGRSWRRLRRVLEGLGGTWKGLDSLLATFVEQSPFSKHIVKL